MLSFLGAFQRGIKEGRRQVREELQPEIDRLREELQPEIDDRLREEVDQLILELREAMNKRI